MSYPILSSAFFQDHTPSKEFFEKWSSLHSWGPDCVPVYTWDGMLFVAFSAEPPTISGSTPIVLVQAEAVELMKLWNFWNDTVTDDLIADGYEPSSTMASSELLSLLSEEEERKQSTTVKPAAPVLQPRSKLEAPPAPASAAPAVQFNDTWTAHVFEQMKYHYTKSMILLRSGNAIIPWKWSSEFGTEEKEASPITLNQPSAFSIVARTLKPYHGYTVPTTVNDAFAEEWNQGTTPDTMTITPIMANDKLVGVLVGIGGPTANNKGSLSAAEKLALEAGSNIELQANQPAAA